MDGTPNETGPGKTGGADSGGLVGIAKSAVPPGPGEVKRGRGRPPGSKSSGADGGGSGPIVANPAPVVQTVWTEKNVGAMVRLPYSTLAWITDTKEISLNEAEQEMIIPAAVEVFNQFAPLAAAKWAGVITLGAGLISVSAAKYKVYKDEVKRREAEAKKLKSADEARGLKTEGN